MKYLIGDIYGNMWNGEDNFYCDKGLIFNTKKIANKTVNDLETEYPRLEGKLKLWNVVLEDE